jgi:hypothetical protein
VDVNVASRACGAPALDPTRRTRKDHTTEGLRAILQKRLDTTIEASAPRNAGASFSDVVRHGLS